MTTLGDHIIGKHNDVRRVFGLPFFSKNGPLTVSAERHAFAMRYDIGLSHENWDTEIWDAGFDGTAIAQNIAIGCTRDTCTNEWMASPSHRAHILNATYVRIGVGHESGPSGGGCWAVNFGNA